MDSLLGWREVRARCGNIGRTSVYRLIRDGKFPAPVAVGSGRVMWRATEIEAWMAALPPASFNPDTEV